jgi:hypothetical protein
MSSKTLLVLFGVALVVFAAYVFKDRIPSPSVSVKRPYTAPNEHKVVPLEGNPMAFEVLDRPGAAGRDYFCAAARYAEIVLRADVAAHVRVTAALGPSQTWDNRRAVAFDVVSDGADDGLAGLVPRVDRPGERRSILVARRFCAT